MYISTYMFQENGDFTVVDGLHRVVQYPFSVNEKVTIKVNFFNFTLQYPPGCIRWDGRGNYRQPISTG